MTRGAGWLVAVTLLLCGCAEPAPPPQSTPASAPATAMPSGTATRTSGGGPAPSGSAAATTFVTLSSPVAPGNTAAAVVQTAPGAACVLAYRTPAGTVSEARGLGSAPADSQGRASWAWVIGTSTRPGVGEVTVTCGSQTARAPITISAR